jgi:hypothetical protein
MNPPNQVMAPSAATRSGNTPAHVEDFVQRLLPHAQAASATTIMEAINSDFFICANTLPE